jgi:hypothetical protein
MTMHVLPGVNPHSPDSSAVNLNAKFRCGLIAYRSLQEFLRVLDGVRMRKQVAQREPDFSVVRMLRQRLRIIQSPRTNLASLQNELH